MTRGLLTGDVTLTSKEDELDMMLSYAYNKIATEADALKLFTANKNDSILRQGPGNLFVRKPRMPSVDNDELDIDDELGFPAARYIASFVSRDKGGIHVMNITLRENVKFHDGSEWNATVAKWNIDRTW